MSKVIFLAFCLVIMAQLCYSGSSSDSRSGKVSDSTSDKGSDSISGKDSDSISGKGRSGEGSSSRQTGKLGLEKKVRELENKTEEMSKNMMEQEKVSIVLKADIEALQGDLKAANDMVEALLSQAKESSACCAEIQAQVLATAPPTTTTTTVISTTPEVTSPPATTTTTVQATTTPDPRCNTPRYLYCSAEFSTVAFYYEQFGRCMLKQCTDRHVKGFDSLASCRATCG